MCSVWLSLRWCLSLLLHSWSQKSFAYRSNAFQIGCLYNCALVCIIQSHSSLNVHNNADVIAIYRTEVSIFSSSQSPTCCSPWHSSTSNSILSHRKKPSQVSGIELLCTKQYLPWKVLAHGLNNQKYGTLRTITCSSRPKAMELKNAANDIRHLRSKSHRLHHLSHERRNVWLAKHGNYTLKELRAAECLSLLLVPHVTDFRARTVCFSTIDGVKTSNSKYSSFHDRCKKVRQKNPKTLIHLSFIDFNLHPTSVPWWCNNCCCSRTDVRSVLPPHARQDGTKVLLVPAEGVVHRRTNGLRAASKDSSVICDMCKWRTRSVPCDVSWSRPSARMHFVTSKVSWECKCYARAQECARAPARASGCACVCSAKVSSSSAANEYTHSGFGMIQVLVDIHA